MPSCSIQQSDQDRSATSKTSGSVPAAKSPRSAWRNSTGRFVSRSRSFALATESPNGSIAVTWAARSAYRHVRRPSPHPISRTSAPPNPTRSKSSSVSFPSGSVRIVIPESLDLRLVRFHDLRRHHVVVLLGRQRGPHQPDPCSKKECSALPDDAVLEMRHAAGLTDARPFQLDPLGELVE